MATKATTTTRRGQYLIAIRYFKEEEKETIGQLNDHSIFKLVIS